jgi:hypothetical protein
VCGWAGVDHGDQELELGFSVGVQRERATFDEFDPQVRAST